MDWWRAAGRARERSGTMTANYRSQNLAEIGWVPWPNEPLVLECPPGRYMNSMEFICLFASACVVRRRLGRRVPEHEGDELVAVPLHRVSLITPTLTISIHMTK